jgi:long-chain fatty acid transport protein
MLTININPSIAYKAGDSLSFGAGVSAQYMKVEYDSMIDQSSLGSADGSVINKGDSWGFGFNAGVLVDITKDARIGLAYRSRIKHALSGTADFSTIHPVIAVLRTLTDTSINAQITMPDTLSLSGHYAFSDQWAVMGDVTYTNWSVFNEVRIKFANGAADGVTTTTWKDSWRYSLGLTYKPTPAWTLRTGIAFDQTPVLDPEHRTPRIPDADRLWLSCGVSYAVSKFLGLDFGYTHIFVNDPKMNLLASNPENTARGNLIGTIDAQVNILSAQVRWSF